MADISKRKFKCRFFGHFHIIFYFSQFDIHFNAGIKELESNAQKCVLSGKGYAIGNRVKTVKLVSSVRLVKFSHLPPVGNRVKTTLKVTSSTKRKSVTKFARIFLLPAKKCFCYYIRVGILCRLNMLLLHPFYHNDKLQGFLERLYSLFSLVQIKIIQ